MKTARPLLVFLFKMLVFSVLNGQVRLADPIDFSCNACLPADALLRLSRQTGLNIAFSDQAFGRCAPVDISARQTPFETVLQRIIACAKLGYKYDGAQVVLFRKSSRHTLSGYVEDAETGERLIGASVRLLGDKNTGAVSNEFGFFSLRLEEGDLALAAMYLGYKPERVEVPLFADRMLRLRLRPDNRLPEVLVSETLGDDPESRSKRMGNPKYLSDSDLKALPMPGGEADVLRQVALQTGVQTGVDGLGGLHVRGGNADHNLFLLDDVPVYSPSHALGLFSIYNPSTVSNIRLWKGDFPARYGGRVASVLDVRTKDGDLRHYRANASVGLFASSLAVEGPIVREKSSFLLGFRTTYLDPWVDLFNQRSNLLAFSGDRLNYRFYDANVKLNYTLDERNRVYFSYYSGGDRFRNAFVQDFDDPDVYITERSDIASEWGNSIMALRWNHVLRQNLFTNSTLRYSRFAYNSRLAFNADALFPSGKTQELYDYGQLYQTLIQDVSGKTDFSFFLSNRLTLRWGAALTRHNFQPGSISANFQLPGQSPTAIDSLQNILLNNERISANEVEGYFDAEWSPWRRLHLELGLNGAVFQNQSVNYRSLQPRLRAVLGNTFGWSAWAGYHEMAQFLHQIGSFNVSLPFELWVPSTRKVKPEQVRQFSLGIGWQRSGWAFQVEAYDKHLDRVLTFLSSNDVLFTGGAEDASGWEDRVAEGTGRSRGLELSVEKKAGSFTASVAYTLSNTTRLFPEINSGRAFPFRFDRRHDLKLTAQQRLFKWLDINALWAYASGNPITLSGVKFLHESVEGQVSRDVFAYTEVNGYRLPAYHRLDMSLNGHFKSGRVGHAVQLGAYNVYNRLNPFFLYVDSSSETLGTAIQYTLLPLLPVFRYELKF
jgi:hypothetical protein